MRGEKLIFKKFGLLVHSSGTSLLRPGISCPLFAHLISQGTPLLPEWRAPIQSGAYGPSSEHGRYLLIQYKGPNDMVHWLEGKERLGHGQLLASDQFLDSW